MIVWSSGSQARFRVRSAAGVLGPPTLIDQAGQISNQPYVGVAGSGDAVFLGTRVPVETLVDYLEDGSSVDEFLDDFPTVRREQAIAALEILREFLLAR